VKSMLYIGASAKAVKSARKTILGILSSCAEQETLRTALTTLSTLCGVNNSTIRDCTLTNKEAK
jgi:hypothetical protein